MRQLLASIFTLLLTTAIALALDPQTKAEIDELISYVGTSGVRFIRNGTEHSGAEGAQHLRDKLARAGNRVKTTEDFITGIASTSYITGKPYLVKFADGHTQPTGDGCGRTSPRSGRTKSEGRIVGPANRPGRLRARPGMRLRHSRRVGYRT